MHRIIETERLYFEPLKLSHVKLMTNWGKHTNTLFIDYDFDFNTECGQLAFYMIKTCSPFKKYFAIIDIITNQIIGYLGMKNINMFHKTSVLGIVLDPAKLNRGYGTEALSAFLEYYFKKLEMNEMILEVAAYNPWAIKLYKNMGFKKSGYFLDEYPNEVPDFENPEYEKYKAEFIFTNGKWYNYCYTMKLTKHEFLSFGGDKIEIRD